MIKKLRLGELLVKENIITSFQLEKALDVQNKTGKKLGDVFIDLGMLDETALLSFLAQQLNLPLLDLNHYKIKPEVIRELPETIARRLRAIPIDRIKNGFLVAMVDPTDLLAYDEVSKRLNKPIRVVIVRQQDMLRVIDEIYRRTHEIASLVGELEEEMSGLPLQISIDEQMGDAPVTRLLNSIFEDAIQIKASDIHLEPAPNGMRLRLRVDGVLQEQIIAGSNILSALILRLKLMAKLNISEHRLPQDGRFEIGVRNQKIDVRISTMPLQDSESAVMRLLDQQHGILRLEQLGLPDDLLNTLRINLKHANGMILVTGPTGSGKSTTLYAGLSEINTPQRKIITVEDPIEYTVERINQIQIQPKIDLTFSNVLRSALRNDPDVVMIGEIRDEETARIALRAAMTGHLVLTTLHTNDSLSAPWRLLDMGVESYLVANSIRLVIAQRLARRNCPYCEQRYRMTDRDKEVLGFLQLSLPDNIELKQGKGCIHCYQRGYKDRIGIYEMLEINDPMFDALRDKNVSQFNLYAHESAIYQPLIRCAFNYACQGIISLQEMLRLSTDVSVME